MFSFYAYRSSTDLNIRLFFVRRTRGRYYMYFVVFVKDFETIKLKKSLFHFSYITINSTTFSFAMFFSGTAG